MSKKDKNYNGDPGAPPSPQSFGSWPTENSGWYYDLQTDPWRSRLTSVSLHCNRQTNNNGRDWLPIPEQERDIQGYSLNPLVTSVLAEDFMIGVQNAWTPFGGDKIGELWGSLKPLAPYAKELGGVLADMAQSGSGADVEKGSWAAALQGAVEWLNDVIHDDNGNNIVSEYLNRVLITQGARFTYYSGTDVNFSNMGMKFTLFSDWDENGNFITVNHKLQKLYPYFIGKLIRNDLHPSDIMSEKDKEEGRKNGDMKVQYLETADEFLDRFVMWQKAPGGYQPSVDYIDACQEGTFKLRFGGYYSIPNLVIADCQLSFSRQMVKFGGGDITKTLKTSSREESDDKKTISAEAESNGYCPLSCDVSLTFQPATKLSDIMVKALTSGYGMQDDIDRTTKLMKANLLNERARLKARYTIKNDNDLSQAKSLEEEIEKQDSIKNMDTMQYQQWKALNKEIKLPEQKIKSMAINGSTTPLVDPSSSGNSL